MLPNFRGHLRSHSVAYVALFLALSGTALAAKPLLTGNDIQNESLTGADVLNNSLKGDDVDESSLVGVDADKLDGKDSTEFTTMDTASGSAVMTASPPNNGDLVATVPLAAGTSFTATARVTVDSEGGFTGNITCALFREATGVLERIGDERTSFSPTSPGFLDFTGASVDSDAGDLTLRCTSDATGVPVAGDVVVTFGE